MTRIGTSGSLLTAGSKREIYPLRNEAKLINRRYWRGGAHGIGILCELRPCEWMRQPTDA